MFLLFVNQKSALDRATQKINYRNYRKQRKHHRIEKKRKIQGFTKIDSLRYFHVKQGKNRYQHGSSRQTWEQVHS